MHLVAGLERQLGLGLEHADVAALTVVLDREHVRPLGEMMPTISSELARAVGDQKRHGEVAAVDREAPPGHRDERRRVDVAAGQDGADVPLTRDEPGEQRRHRRRARALDDELRALEQEHDRLRDRLVLDGDDLVQQVAHDRGRQLTGSLDGDAVGDRQPGGLEPGQRRARRRLHADQPQLRAQRAQRDRDTRTRDRRRRPGSRPSPALPAAARRARARASPGRRSPADPRTVHERRARPLLERTQPRRPSRRSTRRPARPSRRSSRVASTFAIGAASGMKIVARDARLPRRPGDRLTVVAGARGHDAGRSLGLGQRRDRVDGAADLERPRPLQVLGLEVHRRPHSRARVSDE